MIFMTARIMMTIKTVSEINEWAQEKAFALERLERIIADHPECLIPMARENVSDKSSGEGLESLFANIDIRGLAKLRKDMNKFTKSMLDKNKD